MTAKEKYVFELVHEGMALVNKGNSIIDQARKDCEHKVLFVNGSAREPRCTICLITQKELMSQLATNQWNEAKAVVNEILGEETPFDKVLKRPAIFFCLRPEEQWAIDKGLGILDWNNTCRHNILIIECHGCTKEWLDRFATGTP